MKPLVCYLVGFLFSLNILAQGFAIRCVEVDDEGFVTIFFNSQTASNPLHYEVALWNNATGQFDNIDVINDITQTSYRDNVNNASNASLRYRLRAVLPSNQYLEDEVSTIYITAMQNPNNTVSLYWNDYFANSSQLAPVNTYKIYRKRTLTDVDWVFVDEVSLLTYVDTLPQICSDTVQYKIELDGENGCTTCSNCFKVLVGDTQIPDAPILQSSSVNLDSRLLNLNWLPSASDDIMGYVVCAGSPCIAIDTIWGADASNYVCNQCDVEQLNSLAIMAFDSCYNTSLRTERHTNMVLTHNNAPCSDRVSLTWNPYQDFESGLQHYNIYSQKASSNTYTLETTTQSTAEEIQIDITESGYLFYVEAVSNNGIKANSNVLEIPLIAAKQVEFIEIRKVSVAEDNKTIDLEFYVDASILVDFYQLQRSVNGGAFTRIANIPYTGHKTLTYTDVLPSSAMEHSYKYIFAAPDECGLTLKKSASVAPIQMNLTKQDPTTNVLTWTPYLGWENGVGVYDVFRYSPSDAVPFQVGSTQSNTYTDYIADILSSSDRTYYFVKAIENGQGADNKTQEVNSTYAYVQHESMIFVPNAFTPREPDNNIFKPECHFIRQGSYRMRIFNRYGALIFETDDQTTGWDGRFKGEFCHLGTYIYVIEFVNSNGEKETKKGTIALIE